MKKTEFFCKIERKEYGRKENRGTKTKLEQWMQFISQKDEKEVELAMKENEEIKKANEEYEYLTGDEAERRLALLREEAIRDEKTMLRSSREEGIEIGKKENKIEIAKNMLKKGMNISVIAEITELSVEEIEKMKENSKK